MPLYEYECEVCHHRFERIQRVSAAPVAACPSCGGSVRRLLGAPALQFKGSGWYVTDYGKGNGNGSRSTSNEGAKESGKDSASSSGTSASSKESSESSSAKPAATGASA
jgi:putative FmdB family regulatory protein